MSVASFLLAPKLMRSGAAHRDVEALLARMRQRLYPETVPVLGSYWLKTVYARHPKYGWWKDAHEALKTAVREEPLDDAARQMLAQLQNWIQQTILRAGKAPAGRSPENETYGANLTRERLVPYVRRLLNQWVPAEVAYILTDQREPVMQDGDGIPANAVAKAIERLLPRERLSPATLELMLEPELLSPEYIYPADAEILQDVVLALLGRTSAPPAPVMPARLLAVAATSALPPDFAQTVQEASFLRKNEAEEIHVPIPAAQALEMLQHDPVRIASILVTTDGRWWESENLQTGDQNAVVYRPGGRLRIDFSAEHARLRVPWPSQRVEWSGAVHLGESFKLFGREWNAHSLEGDGERTWLNLVFSRFMPSGEVQALAPSPRRSHLASVDMAWAAITDALADAVAVRSSEPVEQLRRGELVPLARAIYAFAESVMNGRVRDQETIEQQLRAIRFHQGEISWLEGGVPWRVLPARVSRLLQRTRHERPVLDLLQAVFEDLPELLRAIERKPPKTKTPGGSTSPSRAA